MAINSDNLRVSKYFCFIIFYVEDVDKFFIYMQNDETISVLGKLESKPQDAEWGERFFHMLDPDGYRLSFAAPIGDE